MTSDDFLGRYAAALRTFLADSDEANLAVGQELGRQALHDKVSMLEIIECHFRLINFELPKATEVNRSAALQFLLQTLVPLDVATRGFLEGTRRYEEQRARAEGLAHRDEFRNALVNSLQEGFFVANLEGEVVEINEAFTEITGYSADGLPYRWPHPWVIDIDPARQRMSQLQAEGSVGYEIPISRRDGRTAWVAVSMNVVPGAAPFTYVGTIRDITAAREAAVRERETSLTLQRAMLPRIETPPGFAVRYEPAVPPLEIGGDWYDVLPVGEHRIGIIVGDCVGRGLAAAAVMGQLRSSAHALLLTGAEPAVLLEQLDAVAELIPDAYCSTVFAAVFDVESRVLQYSRAGHVPALLAVPGSATTMLTGASSVPLAVQREHPRAQESVVLTVGSTLLLFTDGLVERRGEPLDAGLERVEAVFGCAIDLPVEAIADVVLQEMAPELGYDDDVAIVVCRPPVAPLRIEEKAAPLRLAVVRDRLAHWLAAAAVPNALVADIVLAVGEACTNSIEHGYRNRPPSSMRVDAALEGDEIRIHVVDFGEWKTPPAEPGTRGRGLRLMTALSDAVDVESTDTGTTVAMSFRVPAATF